MTIDIITRFLNSEHIHEFKPAEDHLGDRKWREKFVQRFQIPADADDSCLEDLRGLRSATRSIVGSLLAGEEPDVKDVEWVNRFLPESKPKIAWQSDAPGGFAMDRVCTLRLVEFLASTVAEHLTGSEVGKLKLCANNQCRWAFWDKSRNQSRRWCSSAHCGNVSKVRAYRKRAANKSA